MHNDKSKICTMINKIYIIFNKVITVIAIFGFALLGYYLITKGL